MRKQNSFLHLIQILFFAAGFLIAANSLLPPDLYSQDEPGSPAEQQFIKNVYKAFHEKDKEALLNLQCWDKVSEKEKSAEAFINENDLLKHTVKNVKISKEIPKSFLEESIEDGIKYYKNLPILGVIEIEVFKEGDKGETEIRKITYGCKNGSLYFTSTAEEKLNWTGPKDKHLAVMIWSQTSGEQPNIKGYYIYNVSGIEKRKEFEHAGGYSWSFYGQYVKECFVQKFSGDGKIQLRIAEEGKDIFFSKLTYSFTCRRVKKT